MLPNFNFVAEDGLFNFNTLSPNGLIYYKLSTPKDYYWGAWGTKIHFYDEENKLIYSNDDAKSGISIDEFDNLIFVRWSNDGFYALLNEFVFNEYYNFVLLDFKNRRLFRLKYFDETEKFKNKCYHGSDIIDFMSTYKILPEPFIKKKNHFCNLLNPVKYPQTASLPLR